MYNTDEYLRFKQGRTSQKQNDPNINIGADLHDRIINFGLKVWKKHHEYFDFRNEQ